MIEPRESSRPSKDEKRREEGGGRVSLVSVWSLATEALGWSEWSCSLKQSKLSLLDYSTQLLINTQVFDCIGRRKNGMQPAAAILGYITRARCREQFQRNSKFARRRSQLPPQVNTPHTEHGRLSQIQFRSFQSMINPHYWNRKRWKEKFFKIQNLFSGLLLLNFEKIVTIKILKSLLASFCLFQSSISFSHTGRWFSFAQPNVGDNPWRS